MASRAGFRVFLMSLVSSFLFLPSPRAADPVPGKPSAAKSGPAGIKWVHSRPAGIEFTKTEVTVAQYLACVQADKCTAPLMKTEDKFCTWGHPGRDKHPVNCVDWNQATAFCEWAGGRLPTEEEWEAEASNSGKRQYPWGDKEVSCERAVMSQAGSGCGRNSSWPVCSKTRGNSVSGLCDMSGNLFEWTSSWFETEQKTRVVRGGSWVYGGSGRFRASYRYSYPPTERFYIIGFRCGRSASE